MSFYKAHILHKPANDGTGQAAFPTAITFTRVSHLCALKTFLDLVESAVFKKARNTGAILFWR